MLMYGSYKTNKENFPISVTSTGMVITGSGTSAVLTYVATPAAGILSVKSLSSATHVFVATKTSTQLAVQNVYNLNTASFTGGYRIAGTASAVSTNITAGLYRVTSIGNTFYLKLGAAATLTTPTYVMPEATVDQIYIASTKISSITASTAGVLTLLKLA